MYTSSTTPRPASTRTFARRRGPAPAIGSLPRGPTSGGRSLQRTPPPGRALRLHGAEHERPGRRPRNPPRRRSLRERRLHRALLRPAQGGTSRPRVRAHDRGRVRGGQAPSSPVSRCDAAAIFPRCRVASREAPERRRFGASVFPHLEISNLGMEARRRDDDEPRGPVALRASPDSSSRPRIASPRSGRPIWSHARRHAARAEWRARPYVIHDVSKAEPTVVLLVKPETSPRRSSRVLRWVRALLPTAVLIVASAPLPSSGDDDLITLDVDAVAEAGPLSLAATLARRPG